MLFCQGGFAWSTHNSAAANRCERTHWNTGRFLVWLVGSCAKARGQGLWLCPSACHTAPPHAVAAGVMPLQLSRRAAVHEVYTLSHGSSLPANERGWECAGISLGWEMGRVCWGVPEGRKGKRPLHTKECTINRVTRRAWKLRGENTGGSGTERGLYDRMHIAHFLSHFSRGSVSYEPVEMLGNACI